MFSTKERDFSTGLDYFGFRYYDAVLGKFSTRDPSGYPDGPNNYLYVNNNPINWIDPFGLKKISDYEKDIKDERSVLSPGDQRKFDTYVDYSQQDERRYKVAPPWMRKWFRSLGTEKAKQSRRLRLRIDEIKEKITNIKEKVDTANLVMYLAQAAEQTYYVGREDNESYFDENEVDDADSDFNTLETLSGQLTFIEVAGFFRGGGYGVGGKKAARKIIKDKLAKKRAASEALKNIFSFKAPGVRHQAKKVTQNTVAKKKNTVALPGVNMKLEAEIINKGLAKRISKNRFKVNGRIYERSNDLSHLYPISGKGLVTLDRGAFKALGILNKLGNTANAQKAFNGMGLSKETIQKAMNVYKVLK